MLNINRLLSKKIPNSHAIWNLTQGLEAYVTVTFSNNSLTDNGSSIEKYSRFAFLMQITELLASYRKAADSDF